MLILPFFTLFISHQKHKIDLFNFCLQRAETDVVVIQSGTEMGITLGTPISLFVPNEDQRPGDYGEMTNIPRPSHADFTYQEKYKVKASSGGGRSSARETIGMR
jgi:chorismate synthase